MVRSRPLMSSLKQEQPCIYTKRDVILGVAIACGVSGDEAAAAAGISSRWASVHRARWGESLKEIAEMVAPIIKTKRELRAITKAEVKAEMDKLLGGAVDAYARALEKGDLATAMAAADRVMKMAGLMNTKVEVSGSVQHSHEHFVLQKNVAEAFALDAADDLDLHRRARALAAVPDVIDVLPIEMETADVEH
jgi:hypothetical protein